MIQGRQSVFAYSHDRPHAIRRVGRITPATGEETPVASPALELQRALDEMFTATPVRRLDYRRGLVLTAVSVATLTICGAFWWEAARWAASLIV
jgi:hypothetical protein